MHDLTRERILEAALQQAVMELREAAAICRAHHLAGTALIFSRAAEYKAKLLQKEEDNAEEA